MADHKVRQFFGPSRLYPAACVELTFRAPTEPVALAPVIDACRALPRWQEQLPDYLPAEEAIGRLAEAFVARHMPVWSRFRREDGKGIVAVGKFDGIFAANLLHTLAQALLAEPPNRAEPLKRLHELEKILVPQKATNWTLMDSAARQGLEAQWLLSPLEMFQVGSGAESRNFVQLASDADSVIGWILAKNKQNTQAVLRKLGLPGTNSVLAYSETAAAEAARRVGLPCVVKPLSLGKGQGITTRITNLRDLEWGIRRAINASQPPVLVENHVEGTDHRIMVVAGEVLWAYSKVPASVVGDGKASVQELVRRENARRGGLKQSKLIFLEQIRLGDDLVRFLDRRYGIGLDHVLSPGERIELAGQSNISMGGILTDVTADLHPDNRALASQIARTLRIGSLGVDFLTADISRSWKDVPCAIIEINCMPGLSGEGDAQLAMRTQFPNRRSGQIPVLAAIGDEQFRLKAAGWLLDAAERAGVRAQLVEWDRREAMPRVSASEHPAALMRALFDPGLETLVLSCSPEEIEQRGFPVIRADLVLAQDPEDFAFLATIAEEVSPLPSTADAVNGKVAAIVAAHADPGKGGPIPTLSLRARAGESDPFTVECLRFAAVPSRWFHRTLGLPVPQKDGMIGFADAFDAVTRLADVALEREGVPALAACTFDPPGRAWHTTSVMATVTPAPGTQRATEAALTSAIGAINAVIADARWSSGLRPKDRPAPPGSR